MGVHAYRGTSGRHCIRVVGINTGQRLHSWPCSIESVPVTSPISRSCYLKSPPNKICHALMPQSWPVCSGGTLER